MGGACSTQGRYEKYIQHFMKPEGRGIHHLEHIGLDGKVILK
jgi:hypothetical protein